jgi:hypothetical protein
LKKVDFHAESASCPLDLCLLKVEGRQTCRPTFGIFLMNPITLRDVVRFLEGEVSDPAEVRQILDALEANPELAVWADVLTDEPEPDEADERLRGAMKSAIQSLQSTRLWRFTDQATVQKLTPETETQTRLQYERDGQFETLDVSVFAESQMHGNVWEWCVSERDVRGSSQALLLKANFPKGTQPVCLVLGQFDLGSNRVEYVDDNFTLPTSARQMESPREDVPPPQTLPPAGGQYLSFMGRMTRGGELYRPAAAESRRSAYRADSPVVAAAHGDRPRSRPDFLAEFREGEGLLINGKLPDKADDDTVIAELEYLKRDEAWTQLRFPVTLVRDDEIGTALVTDFPWPTDAAAEPCILKVRPLDIDDLPLLSPDRVSALFATESNFVAVPIDQVGDVYRVSLRLPSVRRWATDPSAAWLLRVTQTGEEGRSDV